MWATFAKAIETELREGSELIGVSGLAHKVDAICVDDKRSRIVVASAEPNPRVAALMQVDLQATMPTSKVIVVRPVAVDMPAVARRIVEVLGTAQLDLKAMSSRLSEAQQEPASAIGISLASVIEPIAASFKHLNLPPLNQVLAAVQQAALLDWGSIGEMAKDKPENVIIPLAGLLTVDTMAIDRAHGICPVPLYEFSEDDWDLFMAGRDEGARERLRELDILQYFFPPPDQIAIGLVERRGSSVGTIGEALMLAPELGHPLGRPELTQVAKLSEVVDQLQGMGLLVEGEMGLELSKSGEMTRATIKFRPRESFISKLVQRLSVNLSLGPKDFMS